MSANFGHMYNMAMELFNKQTLQHANTLSYTQHKQVMMSPSPTLAVTLASWLSCASSVRLGAASPFVFVNLLGHFEYFSLT